MKTPRDLRKSLSTSFAIATTGLVATGVCLTQSILSLMKDNPAFLQSPMVPVLALGIALGAASGIAYKGALSDLEKIHDRFTIQGGFFKDYNRISNLQVANTLPVIAVFTGSFVGISFSRALSGTPLNTLDLATIVPSTIFTTLCAMTIYMVQQSAGHAIGRKKYVRALNNAFSNIPG